MMLSSYNAKIVEQVKYYVNSANNKGVCLTKFLTRQEQEILKILVSSEFEVYFDGGYEDAKRKRALITKFGKCSCNVCVYQVKSHNKFYQLKHPTVKWHLLNLGFSEQMFGDILSVDGGFIVVLACEISEYVIESSKYINKSLVSFTPVSKLTINHEHEVYQAYVSSLRLDNVCAKTFQMSRKKVSALIAKDVVSINEVVINKQVTLVKVNDVIKIRKFGKVIIKDIKQSKRKNKFIVIYNRFVR